ncbi:MAG: UvrB/UvrC motif-containing protein [Spirochaetales bacterium]|nr:UvrB/UvrC motif-containing protein [Spirochaetales bacterium]
MRCDMCGASDSVFFIHPDGIGGEVHLCRACAIAKGYATASVDDSLGARLDSLLTGVTEGTHAATCPSCGWTSSQLASTGLLGCAACATTFRSEILSILKRSGRVGQYEGKVPLRRGPSISAEPSRAALSRELEDAIRAEDFEAAAAIRDKLRETSQARKS